MSQYISIEAIKISDKDPFWMTSKLKNAIKQKHRACRKFLKRGRKQEDGEAVRTRKIAEAKNKKLGTKLCHLCKIILERLQ